MLFLEEIFCIIYHQIAVELRLENTGSSCLVFVSADRERTRSSDALTTFKGRPHSNPIASATIVFPVPFFPDNKTRKCTFLNPHREHNIFLERS
eukprot:UN32136